MTVAVMSGRSREVLEGLFAGAADLLLVAEHGGWRRDAGAWQPWVEASQEEVEDLTEELRGMAARHPGARVERKTWSVAFHYRAIPPERREGAVVEVEDRLAAWLRHPAARSGP